MHYALSIICILMVVGLSMSVTSCKDDDDKNNEQRGEQAEPLDTEEAHTAWRWLCVLTGAEELTDNWQSNTYEPTIGIASENNANTRLVVVSTLEEAQKKFSALADVDPARLNAELTINQPGVGKLEWTPSKAGAQNLAEVTVDTKLIPHLQKIIYCTHEQTGLNGLFGTSFGGTAYYRLGDVVQDEEGYYWVCVRPSFEPDKGKSHWINIFNAGEYGKYNGNYVPIPEKNIKSKWNKKWAGNDVTILLPTQLKYSREHLYNLSNLIWALLKPQDYENKVDGNAKPLNPGLCDFEYKYHGKKFLTKVSDYWEENGIWLKLFGHSRQEMSQLMTINFFYQGYSWISGNNATLWNYRSTGYEKTITGSDSKDEEKYDMTKGFDITRYAHSTNADYFVGPNDYAKSAFYDDVYEGYWVVRYKTGKDIFSNYDYFAPMTNCTDVYRYNEKTGKKEKTNIEEENEITLDENAPLVEPKVGCIVGSDGKFYKDLSVTKKLKVNAEAVVLYVGNKYAESNRVYAGAEDWRYNGLAMKLGDLAYTGSYYATDLISDQVCYRKYSDPSRWASIRNGLAINEIFKSGGCKEDPKMTYGHKAYHPFTNDPDDKWPSKAGENATKFSPWFTPSVGQWIMALESFGFTWDGKPAEGGKYNFGNGKKGGEAWYKLIQDELKQRFMPIAYMTSTEYSDKEYVCIYVEDDSAYFKLMNKKAAIHRPVFTAFTYGTGPTDSSDLTDYEGEE